MIGRARESRNPKKVIRVTLMESYGEIGRVPVNLCKIKNNNRGSLNFEPRLFLYLILCNNQSVEADIKSTSVIIILYKKKEI